MPVNVPLGAEKSSEGKDKSSDNHYNQKDSNDETVQFEGHFILCDEIKQDKNKVKR